MTTRCDWGNTDPLLIAYHDTEWGVPLHEDRALFELFILGGAQAGLSWLTILRRRDSYRTAFDGFDAEKIAGYDDGKVAQLLSDKGIIRNRRKIAATLQNARAFLAVQREFGSFDRYVWSFVCGEPKKNRWKAIAELPPRTAESEAMSKDMKRRGFSFAGPTICYAFMQSTGMVNDHLVDCFRYDEVS